MSIPASILAELANLQAQTVANAPVTNAPRAQVIAMQLNAKQLVEDVDAAQYTLVGTLDTWTAFQPPTLSVPTGTSLPPGTDLRGTVDPVEIINGVLGLLQNAQDEQAIVLMRGLVGRVADNLDQLGVPSPPPLPKNITPPVPAGFVFTPPTFPFASSPIIQGMPLQPVIFGLRD